MVDQEPPDGYQEEEQDDIHHPATTQAVGESTNEWVEESSPYNWDESNWKSDSSSTVIYCSSAVHIPSRYGVPTHKLFGVRFTPKERSLSNEGSTQPCTMVAIDKSAEPL